MTYDDHIIDWMVERTPSIEGDIMDPRPRAERLRLFVEICAEANSRGMLERWSYAVRTR
jgi:hypothetical protein